MPTELHDQRATLAARASKRRTYLGKITGDVADLLRQRARDHWSADEFQRGAGRAPNPAWGRWWLPEEKLKLAKAALQRARADYTDALLSLQLFDALHDWPHRPYSPLVEELDEAAVEAQAYTDAGPAYKQRLIRLGLIDEPPHPYPT